MFSKNNIKALIDLISAGAGNGTELKSQLAEVIKRQPTQFKEVITTSFGGALPPAISDILACLHRDSLQKNFEAFFKAHRPKLLDGILLINRFIDINVKDAQAIAPFNLLSVEIASTIEGSFDIFHKAEVLRDFIFREFNFKLESLTGDERLLCLCDAVKRRKCTSLMMAVIYLLLAERFDIDGVVSYAAGKPVVCFRDAVSLEPVFIDITAKGQFVGEEECQAYAQSRGFDFDSAAIAALNNKQIIKRLMSNLIFAYNSRKEKQPAADALRHYLKAL